MTASQPSFGGCPSLKTVSVTLATCLIILASWLGGLSWTATPVDTFSTDPLSEKLPASEGITGKHVNRLVIPGGQLPHDPSLVAESSQMLHTPGDRPASQIQADHVTSALVGTTVIVGVDSIQREPGSKNASIQVTGIQVEPGEIQQSGSRGVPSTPNDNGLNNKAPAPSSQLPLRMQIVGSRLRAGREVEDFRKRWECLTSLKSSEWRLDPTPRPLPWPRSKFKGSCYSRRGYLGFQVNDEIAAGNVTADTWGVADSLKYVWRTREGHTCGESRPDFTAMDGNATCAALRKMRGTLFIVGDSISDQFYLSLLYQMTMMRIGHKQRASTPACQQLAKDVYLATNIPAEMRTLCIHYFICGNSWHAGAVQMHFARSLYLRRVHNESEEQDRLFPEHLRVPELPWAEDAARYRAKVVVLNRGAHFISNKDGFREQLSYTLQEVRRMLPNTLIIYRSTPAGHPNCSSYTHPVNSPLQVDSWPYNWEKFEEQNRIARELVEGVGGVFLDVSPMTSLRPDWHYQGPRDDCLHHCLPGPVDDWVKMLARMLQELL